MDAALSFVLALGVMALLAWGLWVMVWRYWARLIPLAWAGKQYGWLPLLILGGWYTGMAYERHLCTINVIPETASLFRPGTYATFDNNLVRVLRINRRKGELLCFLCSQRGTVPA